MGLVAAFVVRMFYLIQASDTPLRYNEIGVDSPFYLQSAMSLLKNGLSSQNVAYESTQYPLFLAFSLFFFGLQTFTVKLIQVLLDVVTVLGIYNICGLLSMKMPARILATAGYALYGLAIFYTGLVLDTTLLTFFFTMAVWAFLAARKNGRSATYFLAGVLFGATLLFKPHTLFCLFFVLLSLFFLREKTARWKAKRGLLFFCGVLIALSPASIRNHASNGSWSPFPPAIFGIHFYMSYSPDARGFYPRVEGLSNMPIATVKESILKAERETNKSMTPAESSSYWTQKGLKFIQSDPRKFLGLVAAKVGYFWNQKEIANNVDYYFLKEYVPIFRFPFLGFGALAPFALAGILFCVFRRTEAKIVAVMLLLYMTVVVGLTFGDRYRLPCIPLIAVLAAYGLQEGMALVQSGSFFKKSVFGVFFFAVLLLVFHKITFSAGTPAGELPPDYRANSHYNLGAVYAQHNEKENAFKEYQKALEIFPGDVDARNGVATLLLEAGNNTEAYNEYQRSLRYNASYPATHNLLGLFFQKIGQKETALLAFQEAIRLNPSYGEAYNNMGLLLLHEGQFKDAAVCFKTALSSLPDAADIQRNLDEASEKAGTPL